MGTSQMKVYAFVALILAAIASFVYVYTASQTGNQVSTNISNGQPSKDAFGVPTGFQASYTLVKDKDISLGTVRTRRSVRIIVPLGLSNADLENNMRAAMEAAYNTDANPHAITVFAYKPGTPTNLEYTAGTLQWSPHGDWMQADQDVSIEDHQATVEVSKEYRP